MGKKQVFVTGIGIVSSIGKNIRDFSSSLKQGTSGISYMTDLKEISFRNLISAEIRGFNFRKNLEEIRFLPERIINKAYKCAGRSTFAIQAAVAATLEAWQDAELHKEGVEPERIGIVVAGNNISQKYQHESFIRYGQELEYLNPRYALHYMDTDHVGTLSEIFDIKGEGFTVGGASATGNTGIIKGYQLIQLDLVDVCIVVAPPADLSVMEIQGFYNIGAMGGRQFINSPKKACRPFDRDHEGFIYGQAAGCMILESQKSAQRRGKATLVEILGGSLVLDANRLSDPNEKGEFRAMMKALDSAKLEPSDINYINAHGSSSPLGDEVEVKAIKRVFEESLKNIWINSTKGLAGHCLYSAAVIEAISVIVQMKEGFVHPNVNLDNPIDNELRFVKSTYENVSIKYAINNSFAFGGINTCVVLKNSPND